MAAAEKPSRALGRPAPLREKGWIGAITAFEKLRAEDIRRTLAVYLKNPYWKQYYDDAPSETCKRYVALDFFYSDTSDETVLPVLDEMEETELSADDVRFLMKRETGPILARYARLLKRKENGIG